MTVTDRIRWKVAWIILPSWMKKAFIQIADDWMTAIRAEKDTT